jgi:antitoxin (DNA-binding transcriptional repressor) of toxin-antitoxin stability system
MKTVTLRRLRRESRLLDSAAAGEEIVVTRFGKPYVRILPGKTRSFLGAASQLGVKTPVSSEPIPRAEWKGMF